MFRCPKCNKVFKNFHRLKLHYRASHKIHPLMCPVCGRAFINERSRNYHMFNLSGLDDDHAIFYVLEHSPNWRGALSKMVRKRALQLLRVEERST